MLCICISLCLQYLSENYTDLCDQLEPLVNVKDKEEIATTLIHIMQKLDKAKDFLTEVVMNEVLRLGKKRVVMIMLIPYV